MMVLSLKVLLAILPFFLHVNGQASGTGTTTRYWDCCKPSCSWPGKTTLAAGSNPVGTCDANNNLLADYNTKSACDGGSAYMCGNESPWAVSDTLSYGYAAVNIAGGTEASWCCACYELTFTSGPVAGKKMVVQATNTGGDLGANHFDLAMPGGGFGIFNGCTQEYGAPSTGWGAQYGGISSRSQCDAFPAALKAGCYWRFDWFQGADNPAMTFQQVTCPAALTAKTGCVRADDSISEQPTGPAVVATWSSGSSGGATPVVDGTTAAAGSKTSSTAAALSSPVSARTVPKWGQCGGIGYSGPTTCVSGTTCQVGNPWYSQCL